MILAESLSFSYPDSPRPALRGINLRLEPGSLICLAGANGSGKTTLLQVLGGLLRPEGKLEFKLRRNPPFCRYLPQNPELYILGATVEEDLLLGLPDTISRNEALAWLERLDLAQLRAEPVHTLSYGQKRKLCLASALAAQPDLLLLDEPFAGLDFQAALQLRQVLQANRQAGLIQIVSSHDLDLLADLTDLFILLRQGQILAQGRPDQVEPYLEAAGVRPPCHWRLKQQKPLWQEPE